MVGWIQWPLVALDAPVWLARALPGALWLLAILTHATALQRFLRARKLLKDGA